MNSLLVSLIITIFLLLPPQFIVFLSLLLACVSVFLYRLPTARTDYFTVYVIIVISLFFYGLLVGFLNLYPWDHVIRNTTGLVCILSFFFFSNSNLPYRFLSKMIVWIGFIFTVLSCIVFISLIFSNIYVLSLMYDIFGASGGIGDSFRFYSALLFNSFFFLFPLLFSPSNLVLLLFNIQNISVRAIFVLRILALILVSMLAYSMQSKVFTLIFISVTLTYLVATSNFVKSPSFWKFKFRLSSAYASLLVMFCAVFGLELLSSSYNPFSAKLSGNSERLSQMSYINHYLSFWGNGSGAPLPSFLVRDITAPYGTEISYLGVIHNFGVFSLILFIAPLITIGAVIMVYYAIPYRIRILYPSEIDLQIALLFSCAPFFVIAIGNPLFYLPSTWFFLGATLGLLSHIKKRLS
jgi:hypothetical protein